MHSSIAAFIATAREYLYRPSGPHGNVTWQDVLHERDACLQAGFTSEYLHNLRIRPFNK
jgi:hypothetical protein